MPLNILCFGNSLTAGYWHFGTEFHPYAEMLEKQLLSAELDPSLLGNDGKVEIVVEGESGDLVCLPGKFMKRMGKKSILKTYDWIIVLGGTNDLGDMRPEALTPEKIYEALQTTWNLALNSSPTTKVLALTVPECSYKGLNGKRNELNKLILGHKQERFYTFDLKSALPYHAMKQTRRDEIWDDGLHLTDIGYDYMGELIAERLLELLTSAN